MNFPKEIYFIIIEFHDSYEHFENTTRLINEYHKRQRLANMYLFGKYERNNTTDEISTLKMGVSLTFCVKCYHRNREDPTCYRAVSNYNFRDLKNGNNNNRMCIFDINNKSVADIPENY